MKSVYALILLCGLPLFSVAQNCLQLTATNVNGLTGETVCVDFSANHFENVLSAQYTIEWDEQVLDFIEVIPSTNLPGLTPTNFSTLLASQGISTFSWFDPGGGSGVTLADGTPHFTFCFNVIGSSGSQSPIEFTESITAYEVVTDDGSGGFNHPNFNHLNGAFHYGATPTNLSIVDGCGLNVLCASTPNSIIDISVVGGTPPYAYDWENMGITVETTEDLIDFPEGYYEVLVTDATGLETTAGFTIGPPESSLIADISVTGASCPGASDGSVMVQVLSGQAPYQFNWSNGSTAQNQTNLQAGSYTLTITDQNNCTLVETVEITDALQLILDGVVNHPTCGQTDGSIGLFIFGGSPPYTYIWSNGGSTDPLTNLGLGQYGVTITDINGCTTSEVFYLNEIGGDEPDNLINECVFGTDLGTMILNFADPTMANPPFTYTWSDGFVYVDDNSPAGTSTGIRDSIPNGNYTVTVTDNNGCAFISPTYTIDCQPGPTTCTQLSIEDVDLSIVDQSFCVDVTVKDFNDVQGLQLSFLWDPFLLEFSDVSNAGVLGNNGSIVMESLVNPGQLNLLWIQNFPGAAASLSDGEALFTLCFDVLNPGTPAYTTIEFNPGPLYPELVSPDGSVYPVACQGGRVGLYTNLDAFEWNSCVQSDDCSTNNGGAIYLEAVGSNDPATYVWEGPNGYTNTTGDGIDGLASGIYTLTITDNQGDEIQAVYNVPDGNDILLTNITTNPSCSGAADGIIEAFAINGTPPYTYSLDGAVAAGNIFTDLPAGMYFLEVTDAEGCSEIQVVFLSGNSPLDLSQSVVYCETATEGGQIDLIVAGGTAPYGYTWSNGENTEDISGLTAGTYTVTVTDSETCTAIASFDVGNTDITLDASSTTCENEGQQDGAIDITVSSGALPLTFEWSNGATTEDLSNISSGNYTVTVTDANDCSVILDPIFVCLIPDPNPSSCFSLQTVGTEANQGEIICIPIEVTGFDDIVYMQYSINYDPTFLEFNSAQNFNLSGLLGSNIGNPSAGNITTSWLADNVITGETVADNTIIYELCFEVLGSTGFSGINLSGTPTPIEVGDADGIIDPNLVSGSVVISGMLPLQVWPSCPVSASCSGGNNGGSIDPIITGGVTPYSYNWTGPNGFTSTASSIQTLTAGTYNLTVTDANNQTSEAIYEVSGFVSNISGISISSVDCGNTVDIDLTVVDPNITYTFDWSNGASSEDLSGVTPEIYTVTVTDPNGCISTETIDANFTPNYSHSTVMECVNGVGKQYDIFVFFWQGLQPNESYTVEWSNGDITTIPANSNLTELLNVPPGVYAATVTGNTTGCTFLISPIELDGGFTSMPMDNEICPDGMLAIGAEYIGDPATITWSPATGLSCTDCFDPIASPSQTTVYTGIIDQGDGCPDYVYINVEVLEDCVWPGDTDTNKVVNNFDLLNIGLGFGETGPVRQNATLNWEGQMAMDWSSSTPNTNVNYKHADTDGNGVINSDDTLAINLNWGLTHNLQTPPDDKALPIASNLGAVPFYIAPDTLEEGQPASLEIVLGEMDSPANQVYGLAFSLTYDPGIVVPGSARVDLSNSWIGTLNDDMISMHLDQISNGRVDIGITRTDGQPIDGFGEIGRLEIVIEDNIFFNTQDPEKGFGMMEVEFGIENILIINHLEEVIPVNPLPTTTFILDNPNSTNDLGSQLWKISPNPSRNNWTIQAKSNQTASKIQVFRADGKLQWAQDQLIGQEWLIPAEKWPAGAYLIQITSDEGITNLKAIKL